MCPYSLGHEDWLCFIPGQSQRIFTAIHSSDFSRYTYEHQVTVNTIILAHSYWIILPLAIIEGPMITIAASFLASNGLLNVYVVYALALSGDIIGDTLHYAAGSMGGRRIVCVYGHYVGITEEKLDAIMARYFHTNESLWKIITLSKFTHAPSSAVMIASGLLRINFWKFFFITTVNNIFKVLAFVLIGYFFGQTFAEMEGRFIYWWIILVTLFLIIAYLLYRRRSP